MNKYTGEYLRTVVRPKNGVGRPPAERREQLFNQCGKRWGWTHPRLAELARLYKKYD